MPESEPNLQESFTKDPIRFVTKKLAIYRREFVSGFVEQVENWREDEQITPEDRDKILEALKDPQVKIYLNLMVQQLILGQVVRTEVTAALGVVLTGDLMEGAILGEAFRWGLKNIHAQVVGRKLPMLRRQLTAAAVMPSFVGSSSPLVIIGFKHPKLEKCLRLYLKQKGSKRLSNFKKRSQVILAYLKNRGKQKV